MKINILGFGNVGQHLYRAFSLQKDVYIAQVYSRTKFKQSDPMIPFVHEISKIEPADVQIIALPDDVISDFSKKLSFTNQLVVHTSGSSSIQDIHNTRRKGVFYALQTFSKDIKIDFTSVPICIEGTYENDLKTLERLGRTISKKVIEINSEKRRKLHLAAVCVNNFANHLYDVSESYLNKHAIDFNLLHPLILETAKKIEKKIPREVQTGPAKRLDKNTIDSHLQLLKDNKTLSEIYTVMTNSIIKTHHN